MGFMSSPPAILPSNHLSSQYHQHDSEYHQYQSSNNSKLNLLIHSNSSISPSSSSSSTNSSSLYSQPSLPSVPSLTTHPNPSSSSSSASQHRCINTTLKAHTSYVFSLAIAGKHLYSGSSHGDIRLCHRDNIITNNGIQNIEYSLGYGAVKSLVVSGGKVFSAHHDSKIRVWKMKNQDTETEFECVATLPTLTDRFCRVFSAKNYVQVRRHRKSTWVHHVDAVSALTVSHDASLLYSASWDRTFKIWQTSDFRCLESVLNAHDDAINAIVVSVDGFVYTGSADRKIKAWKTFNKKKKHQLVATLEKHKSAINALALSTDGSILYSGACDRSIIVWEKDNNCDNNHMSLVGALRGHTKAILCLSTVSNDLVFSGSADKTIRMWRRGGLCRDYSCVAVMTGHGGPVKCLAACRDSPSPSQSQTSSSSIGGDCSYSGTGCNYVVYSGSLDCDIREWKIWLP